MDDYKKRWEIEVVFQCLKSRGFNFAETHLKDEERLKRLFAVLAIAFAGLTRSVLGARSSNRFGSKSLRDQQGASFAMDLTGFVMWY